ncbi:MAG: hypothetical protein HWD86_07370 [Kangiellaceae bacterium]|nr:hypothetical protein [Kangiellaceae bacterium]
MKHISIIICMLLLTACGPRETATQQATAPTANTAKTQTQVANQDNQQVQVSHHIRYRDEGVIDSSILDECTLLGSQLSESFAQYAAKNDLSAQRLNELNINASGYVFDLEILNALSSGNAFLGHRKQVTIGGTLYKDGQKVDTFKATRNSGGGFFGGFKSSCGVLHRTVNTLGSDAAEWLRKKI